MRVDDAGSDLRKRIFLGVYLASVELFRHFQDLGQSPPLPPGKPERNSKEAWPSLAGNWGYPLAVKSIAAAGMMKSSELARSRTRRSDRWKRKGPPQTWQAGSG